MTVENRDKSKASEAVRAAAGGFVAGRLAKSAPSRLLGYHNVYHGTSKANAENIKKEGLNPKRGGIGGASDVLSQHKPDMASRYKDSSKGQVHFSKSKRMANMFSGFIGSTGHDSMTKQHDSIRAFFTGRHKGRTLSAVMSDSHYRSAKTDYDAGPVKYVAAKTHHGIKPEQIKESPSYKGIRSVVNKNTLRKYYSDSIGRKRAGTGLALAAAALSAGKYAYNHGKNALGLQKEAGELFDQYRQHEADYKKHLNSYYSIWDRPHDLSQDEWDEMGIHRENEDIAYDKMQAVKALMEAKASGSATKPFDEAMRGVERAEYALKNAQNYNKDGFTIGAGAGLLAAAGISPLLKTDKAIGIGALGLVAGGGLLSKILTMRGVSKANAALEQARNDMSVYKSL